MVIMMTMLRSPSSLLLLVAIFGILLLEESHVYGWVSSSRSNNPFCVSLVVDQQRNFATHNKLLATRNTKKNYEKSKRLYVSLEGRDEIDIEAVLFEAELALQVAEDSLATNKKKIDEEGEDGYFYYKTKIIDASASAVGGIILGFLIGGYISLFQISDLDLPVEPVVPPILFSFIFGSIGFASGIGPGEGAGGGDTNALKQVIQSILGNPVKALFESLGLVAKQQVKRGTNAVKAVPGKVGRAAKERTVTVAVDVKDSFQDFLNAVTSKESIIKSILALSLIAILSFFLLSFITLDEPTILQ